MHRKNEKNKVDSLMVISKGNDLLGIVTAKQIQKMTDRSVLLENMMNNKFVTVKPEDTIIDILEIVKENKISQIPVVDNEGKLIGIITKSSLVTTLSGQFIDTDEVS